ncbi:MAG TPA: ABC transporter ATP-binding protein [Ktedonobacterales bacterium]|jgi:ABC-2 type transport system ATP-binding protein|nr:ABC transporter ATP-binding protein [Ktedonobacterales bacterium]
MLSAHPTARTSAGEVLIRTEALSKRFGKRLAVDGVNLEIRRGDVYGLLGPNGSGKTTTLRMLLGLVWPTGGRVELFGHDVAAPGQLRAALQRIGAIVEQPAFYPFLSGRENLAGVATFAGLPPGAKTLARIDAVLEQVALVAQARDAYRKYSLGMKQRLGIAAALLTDPEVVVLDEPTNGLDPAGMFEVRALIGELARRGTTVFLSSHLLYEVQQVCTRVAILKEGHLLAHGLVEDLLSAAGGGGIQIGFAQPEDYPRAVEVLRAAQADGTSWLNGARYVAPEPGSPVPPGGWYLLVSAPGEHASDLNRLLVAHDLYVAELRRREENLEQFFLALTGAAPPAAVPVQALTPVSTTAATSEVAP